MPLSTTSARRVRPGNGPSADAAQSRSRGATDSVVTLPRGTRPEVRFDTRNMGTKRAIPLHLIHINSPGGFSKKLAT